MSIRRIEALVLTDVVPAVIDTPEPKLGRADPSLLLVDEDYQRNLTRRSMLQIRKMVAHWDWRSFQPPLCVLVGNEFHVVDGQHTAIAAATHPKIRDIPILIVEAADTKDRARAFIGRNRDRIAVTPLQLHQASVQAGEEIAVEITSVCRRAGVVMLKSPPAVGNYKPGQTLAISTVAALVRRRGVDRATQTLQICADAGLAPISADAIKAVDILLDIRGLDRAAVAEVLKRPNIERQARALAANQATQRWKAFAALIHQTIATSASSDGDEVSSVQGAPEIEPQVRAAAPEAEPEASEEVKPQEREAEPEFVPPPDDEVTVITADGREQIWHQGKSIDITKLQARFVATCVDAAPDPASTQQIIKRVWPNGPPRQFVDATLWTISSELRVLLPSIGLQIETIKGVGYQIIQVETK